MITLKHLLAFSFSLVCLVSVHAQWKELGLPYGFDFIDSYIDLDHNIYLETADGIYYSSDRGSNWTNTDKPSSISLNKFVELENHEILVSNQNTVYRFNKATKKFDIFLQAKYYVQLIDHSGSIWLSHTIGSNNELYVTKDTGTTYQLIDIPEFGTYCTNYYIDSFVDSFTILVITCDDVQRIYKRDNVGNFSVINESGLKTSFLYINQVTGSIFTLNEDYYISRISLGSNVLIPVTFPDGPEYDYNTKMRLLDNGYILLESDAGFYISSDDGISFKKIDDYLVKGALDNLPSYSAISFINPSDSVILIEGGCQGAGVYISKDNGKSWGFQNDKLNKPFISGLFEDKLENIYARTCSENTFLKSSDKGDSWNKFYIEFNGEQLPTTKMKMNALGHLYAINDKTVYKSLDNGLNFISLNNPISAFLNKNIAQIFVANSEHIYVLSNFKSGIYSNDNGKTWNNINFEKNISGNYCEIDNQGYLYCSDSQDGLVRYSPYIDQIETFKLLSDYYIRDFTVSNNGLIYFTDLGSDTLWVSKDTLKSKQVLDDKFELKHLDAIFTNDSNDVFLQTFKEFQISKDDGVNFDYFVPLPADDNDVDSYVSDNQNLYAFRNSPPAIFQLDKKLTSVKTYALPESIDVSVYPNPNNGEFTLHVGNIIQKYTIEVSNILGYKVYTNTWVGSDYNFKATNTFPEGIYFIKIEGMNGQKGYAKFIFKK